MKKNQTENILEKVLNKPEFSIDDIVYLLSLSDKNEIEELRKKAYSVMLENCGDKVYMRGLVEFSNYCINDCYYCGIRKSNTAISRYLLKKEEIIESAMWSVKQGYGSVVLQSGERNDDTFVDFVCDIVREIKEVSKSNTLPNGAGVTLCIGEQTLENYKKLFASGSHRYLLRIETTSPEIFSQIHPPEQSLENRKKCLNYLKEVGFQVGTGVMIGIPGQSMIDLARDIMFLKEFDIDMIGMGPFIPHNQTPMSEADYTWDKEHNYELSLKMIAIVRLVLKDVNIASTTALQAINDEGREAGLLFGANIIMPQNTPVAVRKEYQLYDGKPCLEDEIGHCTNCINFRVLSTGRQIALNEYGDSKHFLKKML
jgi:biotin synthase